MGRIVPTIGVLGILAMVGLFVWHAAAVGQIDCEYTCPVIAVCDSADEANCSGCILHGGGPYDLGGCDSRPNKDYNPENLQYHGSALGGNKAASPNTVPCVRITPCRGTWYPQTYCNDFIFFTACWSYDPLTNCVDCWPDQESQYDEVLIEAGCYDCPP